MGARLRFVDVFRGLAILLMLHGHTADALLNPAEKASLAFQIYTIFRGFTAPMFLFISGFAFAITTIKYVEDYSKLSEKFLKRIRKFLFITLLGYFLHLPYLSLKKIMNESNFETLAILFSSDVLQAIGISLLILQIGLFLLKDASKFSHLSLFMGIFAFLISPFLFLIDFSKFLPLPISQYLNTFNGSKFPLFPWIGYIMIGNYIGYKFISESKFGKSEAFLNKIFKLSLLAFPSAFTLELIYEKLFNPNQFLIYSSPFLAVSRISFVIVLFYLILKVEKNINLKVHPLQILGMESLFAYVFHLMIVYGSPINPNFSFSAVWGETLSYTYVFILFLILTTTTLLTSYLLYTTKQSNYRLVNYIKFAFISATLLVFLVNPY